jgi:hypothetical protein
MNKKILLLLLLVIGSSAFAQRALQFRISLPSPTVGIGLELPFERNVVANIYGDAILNGPNFLLGGEIQYKPDLGQFDRDFRGIKPYVGGGVILGLPSANFGVSLSGGVEFALDSEAGLFIGGQSLFGNGTSSRILFGASFR